MLYKWWAYYPKEERWERHLAARGSKKLGAKLFRCMKHLLVQVWQLVRATWRTCRRRREPHLNVTTLHRHRHRTTPALIDSGSLRHRATPAIMCVFRARRGRGRIISRVAYRAAAWVGGLHNYVWSFYKGYFKKLFWWSSFLWVLCLILARAYVYLVDNYQFDNITLQ